MKAFLPVLLLCVVVLCGGCGSQGASAIEQQRSVLMALKNRNAGAESDAQFKRGRVVFYACGSLLEGYALPGLTKDEVSFLETQPHEIANEFPTDPPPFFATKEYWDEVERFASTYNRRMYQHLITKKSS